MMRNTTATKSSTPLMTITSPTPFRQGRPLPGKRDWNCARSILAGAPSRTPPASRVSEPLSDLAPKTSDGQAEKPPAGVPSSLSPSGSRGGPAGASAPGSTSSTSGGGEELNGLAGAGRADGGASPGMPGDGAGGVDAEGGA